MKDVKILELWTTEIDSDVNEAFGDLGYEVREIINPSGEPVGKKAILKDGDVVAIVGMNHKLIPNEVLRGYVERVAAGFGAERWRTYQTSTQYVDTFYIPRAGNGEGVWGELNIGFTVANSIDGSIAMKVMGFTYRELCRNGVIIGLKDVTQYLRLHTQGFLQEFLDGGVDMVRETVKMVLEATADVVNAMDEWPKIRLHSPVGVELLERIRESHLPLAVRPAYALPEEHPKAEVPPESATVWDLYNDITAKISHEVEEIRPASILDYYGSLHKALLVVEE